MPEVKVAPQSTSERDGAQTALEVPRSNTPLGDVGTALSDTQRAEAFSLHTPSAPDIGGTRVRELTSNTRDHEISVPTTDLRIDDQDAQAIRLPFRRGNQRPPSQDDQQPDPNPEPDFFGELENDVAATQEVEATAGGPPPPEGPPDGDWWNGGDGEPPEGPRGPEAIWGERFEARGIAIRRRIIGLEALSYDEKYNQRDPAALDTSYVELKKWRRQSGLKSFKRRPFQEPVSGIAEENISPAQATAVETQVEIIAKQDLEGLPTPAELLKRYNDLRDRADKTLDEVQRNELLLKTEESLSRYFLEAKRLNLLGGIDRSLRVMYVDIMKGVYSSDTSRKKSEAEIWDSISQSRVAALDLAEKSFLARRRRSRADAAEISKVHGIWEVYADLAIERFALLLNGEGLIGEGSIAGEFNFCGETVDELAQVMSVSEDYLRRFYPSDYQLQQKAKDLGGDDEAIVKEEYQELYKLREQSILAAKKDMEGGPARQVADLERYRQMSEDRTLFWKPTYANYFEVYARTPEEYRVVVDTFTQWIRNGVSKSPPELFQRVRGMIDALTTAGQRERATIDPETLVGFKEELEGLIGVLGANDANERYNPAYYKQFMDSIAQDTGLARFLRLGKANRGKVASVLWKLDRDPRVELYFSSHGSRGQLLEDRSPLEQELLQREIEQMLIFETMACEIKPYDPEDPQKRTAGDFNDGRKDPAATNLDEVTKFKSDKEFRSLYEGFGPQEQLAFRSRIKISLEDILRYNLIDAQIRRGQKRVEDLSQEERGLFERVGSEKVGFKSAEWEYAERLLRVERMHRKYISGGFNISNFDEIDRRMYEEASSAVMLGFEMYGVMGEKAKRGGAVIRVERWIGEGQERRRIVDAIPMHQAEKFVHFAENWVKATYGAEELSVEIQEKLGREVMGNNARYDQLKAEYEDPNTPNNRRTTLRMQLYPKQGITAKELKFRVDHARRMAIWALKTQGFEARLYDFTPFFGGEVFDPNGIIGYSKYGINRDRPMSDYIDRYRYAVPLEPRFLGYTKSGKPVLVTFNNEGKINTTLYDQDGQPYSLDFNQNGQLLVYRTKHDPHNSHSSHSNHPVVIENITTQTSAERVKLKQPKVDQEGKRVRDEDGMVVVETSEVTFDQAISHIYSRWTAHPYWGYQEQDTQLLKEAIVGARRIQSGKSRPEDESPHSTQALIMDASLNNIVDIPLKEDLEDYINLAAVEASFQGHIRITDELHMAFYPADANKLYANILYNLQDFGGSTKTWYAARALGMRWTDSLIRRGRTLLPVLPLHYYSMAETWGAPSSGALDVLRMMGYGEYRMVGQFATEKWINQIESAQDIYEILYGWASPQEKRDREGWGEKIVDDADALQHDYPDLVSGTLFSNQEHRSNAFVNSVRKTRGRKEKVSQRIRVHETGKRGEKGPQWIEGYDVWERNADGSLKRDGRGHKILNKSILNRSDSGSSRHSGTRFHWQDVRWLRSDAPGEGASLYPDSAKYYAEMDLHTAESRNRFVGEVTARGINLSNLEAILAGRAEVPDEYKTGNGQIRAKLTTGWQWELGKEVR